jgi:hypothetical protein
MPQHQVQGGQVTTQGPTPVLTNPGAKRKKVCLSGSVILCWVGRVRPEMLCLHTRLPLLPKTYSSLF